MNIQNPYIKRAERKVGSFLRKMVGQVPRNRVEMECAKECIGNWVVCPEGLSGASTILSLGVGNDVGFDRQIIDRFGCDVHAFDPTPICVEWVKTQGMPPQFHFYPYAIGSNDKLMQMYPRLKKGKRSKIMMTMIDEGAGCENTGVTVKVKRIPTIVRELGFQKIDILKMDIEGAEYEVIDDTLDSGIPVYQIILEFHHRFRTLSVEMTKSALLKLNAAGYRIFHISDKCREYSLIHETMLRQYSPERNLPQTS